MLQFHIYLGELMVLVYGISANAQFITTGKITDTQIIISGGSSETYNYYIIWTNSANGTPDLLTATDTGYMNHFAGPFNQDFSDWNVSSTKILAG